MGRHIWVVLGVGAVLAIGTGVAVMREPRGIRNKNPLNIEKGADWVGLSDQQTDKRFAQFVDHRYGYRAATRIVDNYRKRGLHTLTQIINTWAPSHENDTGSYVATVSNRTGFEPDRRIGKEDYPALFAAMTYVENGEQPYPIEEIAEGVSWA